MVFLLTTTSLTRKIKYMSCKIFKTKKNDNLINIHIEITYGQFLCVVNSLLDKYLDGSNIAADLLCKIRNAVAVSDIRDDIKTDVNNSLSKV